MSIVKDNLMNIEGYSPYCGSKMCKSRDSEPLKGERWPRTIFNGEQFYCPKCNWVSSMKKVFIDIYKTKWSK